MQILKYIFLFINIGIGLMYSSVLAITQNQRDVILELHNLAREKLHLPDLIWDSKIEKQAQEWANTLAKNNVFKHSTSTFNKWMWENLYTLTTSDKKIQSNGSEAVILWINEWNDYDFDSNTCNIWAVCGHFTQIIWKNTKRVGCGQSIKKKGSVITLYWVCQYDPPGNYIWERPF